MFQAQKQESAFFSTIILAINFSNNTVIRKQIYNSRHQIKRQIFTLIDVCAPNKDDPEFLEKNNRLCTRLCRVGIIFGGDFNTVLNVEKDKKGRTNTNNHNNQGI